MVVAIALLMSLVVAGWAFGGAPLRAGWFATAGVVLIVLGRDDEWVRRLGTLYAIGGTIFWTVFFDRVYGIAWWLMLPWTVSIGIWVSIASLHDDLAAPTEQDVTASDVAVELR